MSSRSRVIVTILLAAMALAACGTAGPSGAPASSAPASAVPSTSAEASASPSTAPEPVALTVGLGFIPSVQFAPFYHAHAAGYYADAGLDVTFQNTIDPDLITLVGQGAVDLGLADGTSVIPAVSQGIPVTYIATIYGRFPSIVFAKASGGITGPADLAGTRLGIPGRFGSSWIMLQALLGSVGLTLDDLEIVEYPDFGQGAAVIADAVDAATGFTNNEPVQLELTGEPAVVLRVDDVVPLPGNGLIVGPTAATEKADAVRAFVAQTLRAMEEIAADPQVGLDAAFAAVPDLATAPDTQAAILDATIEVWRGPVQEAGGYGAIDADGWAASVEYLDELGLVPNPVDPATLVSTDFLP